MERVGGNAVKSLTKIFIYLLTMAFVIGISQIIAESSPSSRWKCSLCGEVRRQVVQSQPSTTGCKSTNDKKHIWFQIQ